MSKNPHASALGQLGGVKKSPEKTKAVRKNARFPRRRKGESLEDYVVRRYDKRYRE